jgi:hypothetical protein
MVVKSPALLIAAIALFLAFLVALIFAVIRLVRSNREQILASAQILSEQEINLRAPGEILLLLEVPRIGSDFRNFDIEITERASGQTTKMKYDYLRAQGAVYGVTTMRVPLGRLNAKQAGTFLVRIAGLQPENDYAGSRVLFSRPYLGRMIGQILVIVFCGIGMLLCLIFAAWQLFPLQHG